MPPIPPLLWAWLFDRQVFVAVEEYCLLKAVALWLGLVTLWAEACHGFRMRQEALHKQLS